MSSNIELQTFIDLLDNFSQGVVIYKLADPSDPMSFKFMYVNEQADIMRAPDNPEDKLSDHIGETFRESYPELEKSGFPKMLYEALINNERKTFDQYLHASKYVSKVILKFEIIPLSESYVAGVYTDITEKTQTERKLSEMTKLYQKLTENAPYGIVGRRGTQIVFVNKTFVEMLGFDSDDDILGKPIERFISPNEIKRLLKIAETRAKGTDFPLHYESELLHKDGTILPVEVHVAVIDPSGQDQMVMSFIRDLTDVAKLKQNIEIKHRMDSIGVLASGIVHDFNNIMTVITMNLSLLQDQVEAGDVVNELISQSLEATNHAGDLVTQIRSLSSKSEVQHEVFDLYEPVSRVVELMDKIMEPEINFQINLEPGEYNILANKSHIHQVIFNLLTNSIDAIQEKHREVKNNEQIAFSKSPYVSITVSKGQNDGGSDFRHLLKIIFEDNGIGIKEEIVDKIFDPLYTTKKMTGSRVGQGLGLSVVYNIIKNYYHGNITVETVHHEWTRFELSIPQPDITLSHGSEESNKEDDQQLAGTETILVIDDNNFIRHSLKVLLEQLGYHVLQADNGMRALEILEDHQEVDIVILDIIMPVYSGIRFLQNFENKNNVPIVVCTGFTDSVDVTPYNVAGFLEKPFTGKIVAKTIRKILD